MYTVYVELTTNHRSVQWQIPDNAKGPVKLVGVHRYTTGAALAPLEVVFLEMDGMSLSYYDNTNFSDQKVPLFFNPATRGNDLVTFPVHVMEHGCSHSTLDLNLLDINQDPYVFGADEVFILQFEMG